MPVLRRLRPDDASDVLAAFASSRDMARQGNVMTLGDAARYIETITASPREAWGLDDDGRLVGVVGLDVDEANRNAWFWYWLHAETRGKGWMRRAAATVADWALSDRGLERLELGHRANNPASAGVARAAGFIHEDRERTKFLIESERIDVLTYGRLRTDPFPDVEHFEMRGR